MKAQNDVGRNSTEFIRWMNDKTNNLPLAFTQIFFDAWKEGYEPSAVFEYLHSELYMARMEFGMKMTSMSPKMDMKKEESFDYAYQKYRKSRDEKLAELKSPGELNER